MLSRKSKHSDHGQDIRLDGEPQHNLVIIVTIMTVTSTKASSPTQPTSSPIRRLIVILIAHFNLFAISFKLFQFWFISGSIIFSFAFKSFINDNAHRTQGYKSFERWSYSWFLQVSQFLSGWQDTRQCQGSRPVRELIGDWDNHGAVTQGWEEAAIGRS